MIVGIYSYGQQSINTAGGDPSGPGQASFSVGQVVYTALNEPNGARLIQGVQVPFEFVNCLIGEDCENEC